MVNNAVNKSYVEDYCLNILSANLKVKAKDPKRFNAKQTDIADKLAEVADVCTVLITSNSYLQQQTDVKAIFEMDLKGIEELF